MIRRDPYRVPGRHRAGQAKAVVHHRVWDGPARAEAERLDRAWPGWTVLYGTGSRCFYAVAAWPAPESLIVSDPTPEGLEEQMREAETTVITQHERREPAPDGARVPMPPDDRRLPLPPDDRRLP
ncbi:hypothetical protein ABZV14_02200 [Streptosporangium canum]|uniref:hypothetical protein n=1 Tax=Streptosporangium canum TaxID=324952 RepID=UPI0033B743BF